MKYRSILVALFAAYFWPAPLLLLAAILSSCAFESPSQAAARVNGTQAVSVQTTGGMLSGQEIKTLVPQDPFAQKIAALKSHTP